MSNPTPTAPIPDKSAVVASPSSTSSMGNKDGTTKQALLRCPRCDSSNTKFCYYNNYSLSQPRHFCKTCRRYWTQGGALRNVPVGGGCRKNKKLKSSSSSSSSTAIDHFGLPSGHFYGPFGTNPSPNPNHRFAVEPSVLTMGFMGPNQLDMAGHVTNFVHQSSSLASSIESLSCINQDMHWKLQQQRLSVFFAGDIQNKQQAARVSIPTHQQLQEPNPIDHQLFSSSANSASNNKGREEWLFVNSGSSVNPNLTDGGGGGGGFGDVGNPNWSSGVQATWTTTLP